MNMPWETTANVEEANGSASSRRWMIWFALSTLLFLLFRLRWIGHLLVWDEAMDLCSVRSLASCGDDFFSGWFWRHPPVFNVLLLALRPLQAGFAERAELLAVAIGTINMALLFAVNSRIFNRTVALWSIFLLAVAPGSAFFDVWVKTDHPVTTFGLLAILLAANRHVLYAGLCLGLALLSKETGIFYAGAVALIWLSGGAGQRNPRNLVVLVLAPILTAGWWFVLVAMRPGGPAMLQDFLKGGIMEHVRFAFRSDTGWQNAWHFYFSQLPHLLGVAGLVLGLLGAAFLVRAHLARRGATAATPGVATLWPLFLLVPSYLLLAVLPNKVPWVPAVLFPGWVTLQAVAVAACMALIMNSDLAGSLRQTLSRGFAAWMTVLLCISAVDLHYEDFLRKVDFGQWRGASISRQTALGMNNMIKDTDRVLITTFHYWKGLAPGSPCAVFTYYFQRRPEILMRPNSMDCNSLVRDIKRHDIDWALLSPDPGIDEREVFGGFMGALELHPCKFPGAFLFNTTTVAKNK